MHHLSVNTGGGGGRQVNALQPPVGVAAHSLECVHNYVFRGMSVSM